MKTLPVVQLVDGWEHFPTEDSVVYGLSRLDDSAWERLHTLNDWPQMLLSYNEALYFRHCFTLAPTQACVHYHFHIEHAPPQTDVYINGLHLGTTDDNAHFDRDITNFVSLDNNVVLLKVCHVGTFGEARLYAVPCDAAD
ncbi:MAG: hypothetical protein D6737_01400 [Chloroflexi bacterium]|nr:MAG: hypothetical protein D6737_01400 [Chloroflexota bacterium]